mgnify:CR=1 FL=1
MLLARHRRFCFEISTPGRNYFIHAASKQELDDWITALAGTGLKFKSPDKMVIGGLASVKSRCRRGQLLLCCVAQALLTYDGPAQTVPVYVFSKHGYLQKRGAINKSFKTRFCRTTENAAGEKVLAYYKAADELEPQVCACVRMQQGAHFAQWQPASLRPRARFCSI